MSTKVLIVSSGPQSAPIWRGLTAWLIGWPAKSIAHLIVVGLEYRLRRRTHQILSAMDDRMLADIGLRRSEIDAAIQERGRERLPHYDAMI